jgi:hypothetical protein
MAQLQGRSVRVRAWTIYCRTHDLRIADEFDLRGSSGQGAALAPEVRKTCKAGGAGLVLAGHVNTHAMRRRQRGTSRRGTAQSRELHQGD